MKKKQIYYIYIIYIIMHLLDTNYENMGKKTKINLFCNVFFFFSCFHNYVSKNAFARCAIFSFLVTFNGFMNLFWER